MRTWTLVRCTHCHHTWDEDDSEAEVCACIDKYGQRSVVVISSGATNQDEFVLPVPAQEPQ